VGDTLSKTSGQCDGFISREEIPIFLKGQEGKQNAADLARHLPLMDACRCDTASPVSPISSMFFFVQLISYFASVFARLHHLRRLPNREETNNKKKRGSCTSQRTKKK
jgi:hypothetical protein